jgi:hypothetical protein
MDEKIEKDESFNETTLHARMVCKCGTAVWYGYGKMHTTRPLFCKKCTEKELDKIMHEGADEQELIYTYLRRKIQHG